MSKCKKPDCDCLERAEQANGGEPLKHGYPCLYGNDSEMAQAAKQKPGISLAKIIEAQIGTPDQSNLIEDHIKEYFTRFPSYEGRFTYLEWYHIFLDFLDKIPTPSPKDQPREPISYGGYARDPEVNPSLKRAQESEFKQGEIPEEICWAEWSLSDAIKASKKMQEDVAKLRAACFDYQQRYNEANTVAEHERMVSYKLREEIREYRKALAKEKKKWPSTSRQAEEIQSLLDKYPDS